MTEEQLAARHSDQCAARCPTCLAIDLKAAREAAQWLERQGCIAVVVAMADELDNEKQPMLASLLRLAAVNIGERPR